MKIFKINAFIDQNFIVQMTRTSFICMVLFILAFNCLAVNTYSQTARLSMNVNNPNLKDAIVEIKKQTEFDFLYSKDIEPLYRENASITVDNGTIEDVLSQLFKNSRIDYRIINKTIVLVPGSLENNALQGFTITGIVTDSEGNPLPGASVVIKDAARGTVTDLNGAYSLQVPAGNTVLVFSFVGYTTQEFIAGDQRVINVTLSEDARELEEVIVIGYGTAKRQEYTGSVGSVKVENTSLALMPNLNALESLKGTVAGMNIGAVNSAGGEPNMLIRGQNSINGDNKPLILLDGVIFMGSLADINPNDIASYDVLKDAVSSAAYGSRSANGVISITTKKGRSPKPVITLNASAGVQTWPNRPEVLKGEEWLEIVNLRNGNSEGTTSWLSAGELANRENNKETVWLDEATRVGTMQDYQLSVSGGREGINYYLSTSYNNNHGVVIGDEFERISVFGKINTDITGWLNIGADANFSRLNYQNVHAAINVAQLMSPYGVMYRDDKGNLERYPYGQSLANPLWGVEDNTRDRLDMRNSFRLNTYAVVRLPWVKGLSYRIHFLPNLRQSRIGNFFHENYYIGEGEGIERYAPAETQKQLTNANGNMLQNRTYSYVFDNILTYKNTFGKHGVEATLVATRDRTEFDRTYITGKDFVANGNTSLGMWALHKAGVQTITQGPDWERANIGYLARANYSYESKYFFTGSVRRDGASVFGENRKWGTFAAAGVAWRITEENFMKRIDFLNNLKLKFAWGQNGNQGVDPYTTLSKVVNGATSGLPYEFSNTGSTIYYGLNQTEMGNADLGWEKTNAWNIGFESAWLRNRLFVDLDMYYSQTTDQIFERNIPVMTGFKTVYSSMGRVDNKGVELNIRSVNIEAGDLTWMSNLTFWLNRNKLVKLYGELDANGKEKDDIDNSLFIGKSLSAIYGFRQIGIVQEDDTEYIAQTGIQPGMPKYADLDGKAGISADGDREILGYGKENFRLNLGNTVSYKGFELYVLVTGIFGGNNWYMKENTRAYLMGTGGRFNENTVAKPYWTPENKSNEYPALGFVGDGGKFLGLQSHGFVRIQDIAFSYTFNQPWVKAAKINALKVFFTAKNVAWFTKWDGGDPETAARYFDDTLPVVATYSLGLNVSF